MVHLPYLSAVRVTGPDALDFLQSQLSADIRAVSDRHYTFAAYCTPRGKVLALLLVGRRGDEFVLAGAAELLPGVVSRLRMYVLRAKVEFGEPGGMVFYGLPPGRHEAVEGEVYSPITGTLEYALAAAPEVLDVGRSDWKARELIAGVTWLSGATTEKFIPQMLGHESIGALSFKKGCYPGQEIVARARYLGKVKREPVIVQVKAPVPASPAERVDVIYAGEEQPGQLVDSAPLEDGGTVLFIVSNPIEGRNPESVRWDGREFPAA